jgi:hypothetical protein
MGEAKRRKKLDQTFGKSRNNINRHQKKDPLVSEILSLILSDKKLVKPIYVEEVKTEQECNSYPHQLPLVHVWNDKQQNECVRISFNGKIIGGIVELFCERNDPNFIKIRDEVLLAFSKVSRELISEILHETGASPREIFENFSDKTTSNYKDWKYLQFIKKLIKNSLESKNKEELDKYLDILMYLVDEKNSQFITNILGDCLLEVSYSVFFWYNRTYTPHIEILHEDDPALEDSIVGKGIQMMIQDGLILGQDFSFYKDENDKKHIRFSSDAMSKMKPKTLNYIKEVTD